jgi:hypothetical protein
VTVHFCINGCGNVAPAPVRETEGGCHPATDDVTEAMVVAELIVSELISDDSLVIDEDSDINVEICCILVALLELLIVEK